MKTTMTVHKALSELKTLGDRIEKEISNAEFFAVNKHSSSKVMGVPVTDFVAGVRGNYASVRTLINYRNAIKRAVTKSNAIATVQIGGETYTVAEAIEMKATGMSYLASLLSRIESQYNAAKRMADRKNGDELDRRADEYVKSLYENADMKNMSEEVEKVRKTFVESQTMDVIDPIGAEKVMKELKDKIDAFMTEVDSALSVSNALTTIEVEYETL